jgi:general secretion pathway protein N
LPKRWIKPAAWFAILLLAALLATLCRLPAAWADRWLQTASDGRLRLFASAGTLWRGEGLLAHVGRDGELLVWRPLAWQLEAGNLWRGEIGIAACQGCSDPAGAGQAVIHLSPGGWRLAAGSLELPAPLLAATLPLAVARGGWLGEASLRSEGLACDREWRCRGSAELSWRGAASELLPGRRFGDYRLALHADGSPARLELATLSGELRLSGQGLLRPGGIDFEGTAEGPPELVDRLPNIAAPYARPGERPGQAIIALH